MAIKARGELISVTDRVSLSVSFYDALGHLKDCDFSPRISLVSPSGAVNMPSTSAGVERTGTGQYRYLFTVPIAGPEGVWQDIWQGTVDGQVQTITLSIIVFPSNQYGTITPDGYYQLGVDPGFDYSQLSILNLNKLLKTLKARLNSSGKIENIDPDTGNTYYSDCDIFSTETLITFLAASLSEFNAIPHFTFFTFEHTNIIDLFHYILVEGAVIYALSSQALTERGREWQLTDNGVAVNVPTVSELMNSQYSQLYTTHLEKLKQIKASMKPGPQGLGSMTTANGSNPLARRLSLLRARRLF